MTIAEGEAHRVVVVGGGFGGLQATLGLRRAPVEITLVDRRNLHLFQPLSIRSRPGRFLDVMDGMDAMDDLDVATGVATVTRYAKEVPARRPEDQAARTRAVRAKPSAMATGSANPIQNASSSGSSASETAMAARFRRPQHPPDDELSRTHEHERDEKRCSRLDADVLEGPAAVGRVVQEAPVPIVGGEVPRSRTSRAVRTRALPTTRRAPPRASWVDRLSRDDGGLHGLERPARLQCGGDARDVPLDRVVAEHLLYARLDLAGFRALRLEVDAQAAVGEAAFMSFFASSFPAERTGTSLISACMMLP